MTEGTIDWVRQLVELGVTSGRELQSPQTHYLHYCYQGGDEERDHTIPIYDNFLFTLTLMKTKTAQNVTEAKNLLEKLLHFKVDSNFPVYLHEFPECKDRNQRVQILPVLLWILKDFSNVLGEDLRKKVETTSQNLLEASLSEEVIAKAPFQVKIKIGGAAVLFGTLLKASVFSDKGNKILSELVLESKKEVFGTWFSPAYIADTLVGLQMAFSKISESPWKHFWFYLQRTWSNQTKGYTGPALKVFQKGCEPEATLYDLFLGQISQGYSYHAFNSDPYHLQGALIQPTTDEWRQEPLPFTIHGEAAGQAWIVRQDPRYSFSAINVNGHLPPELKKGFLPFRMIWGDVNFTHSLVAQGGSYTTCRAIAHPQGCDLIFLLAEPIPENDRDQSHEIAFYIDQHEGLKFWVDQRPSTTFQIGQQILLQGPNAQIEMKFKLEDGQGKFFGHLMPGNRAAQINLKGTNRFNAYDWQISLRTVRRDLPCTIRVEIRVL